MMGEDNDKQDKTRELAATSVETKPLASVGKPGREPLGAPAGRQTERKKYNKKTQTATTPAASTYNVTLDTESLKQQVEAQEPAGDSPPARPGPRPPRH